MKTSYFAINGQHPDAVAICATVPNFYKGKRYKKLAPTWGIFKEWKESGNDTRYTERYIKEVLDKLDSAEVYADLGEDAILICYESSEKFCHRHIVAKWLKDELGIDIQEVSNGK